MTVIGWDVGGAHLKAAAATAGRIVAAVQVPCPLWQGLDRLEQALGEVLPGLPEAGRHAVTMTGELVDLFASRAEGVTAIAAVLGRRLAGEVTVYAGPDGFVDAARVGAHVDTVAAANWHASAALAARRLDAGLLIDIGSTTADIVPFAGGVVTAAGYDDTARLAARELVYRGVVRTPVMAVAPDAAFAGRRVPLMAELFATMADVYRLTGELPPEADQQPTADGRGKSAEESAARLARMIGRNFADVPLAAWRAMAVDLAAGQRATVLDAARRVVLHRRLHPAAPVVAAGVGAFLAVEAAAALGRRALAFESLIEAAPGVAVMAGRCAPAAAVALLAQAP